LDVLDGDDGLLPTRCLFLIMPTFADRESARKDTNPQNNCRDCGEHTSSPLFDL
jgi:hypothetical protein